MSRIPSKIRRLTWSDWKDAFVAYRYLLLAGWTLFLRRRLLDRWVVNQKTTTEIEPITSVEQEIIDRTATWTNRVARYPFPWARCLQRSLALCLWLEHKGISPQLRIGVRKDEDGLDAHAWVRYKGQILNDDDGIENTFATLNKA